MKAAAVSLINAEPRPELCLCRPAHLALCVLSQALDTCKGTSSRQGSLGRAYHLLMITFTIPENMAISKGTFFFLKRDSFLLREKSGIWRSEPALHCTGVADVLRSCTKTACEWPHSLPSTCLPPFNSVGQCSVALQMSVITPEAHK